MVLSGCLNFYYVVSWVLCCVSKSDVYDFLIALRVSSQFRYLRQCSKIITQLIKLNIFNELASAGRLST